MSLVIEELERKLKLGFSSKCYLLLSTEPFLLQEARSRIWQHARTQGFSDRQVWEISSQSNWDHIKQHNSFLDVFGKQLLDLRLTESLKADTGNKLQMLVEQLTTQSNAPLVVVSYAQSIKKAQLQSWFQTIASKVTLVVLPVPVNTQLPGWVTKQFNQKGFHLAPESIAALLEYTEGNLLAIMQTLEKLALIYAPNTSEIKLAQLQVVLEDQSIFELFHLTEAILQGKSNRCLRIIQRLRTTSVSQALVLGYLLKLLRTAVQLHHGRNEGYDLNKLFLQHQVWKNQHAGFEKLIARMQTRDIPSLFQLAHDTDRCIKGVVSQDGWHGLQQLSLYLAGSSSLSFPYNNINK